MNILLLRKALTYAMMVCAFGTLHLSGELSPIVIGLFYSGALVSWFWEPPRVDLAAWARPWTFITVGVFVFTIVDLFVIDEVFLISALNFMLFLATAKLFQRQEDKDYTQAMALSLLLLAAGAALNENLSYGVLFAFYVVVATLGMTTQHLNVEIALHPGLRRPRMERAIVIATTLLGLAVFAGSTLFFFAFPRIGMGAFVQQSRRGVTSSGFGESVELGGHGTIQTDAAVVLRVTFPDGLPFPIQEIRWRGLSLDQYDGRRWNDTDEDLIRTLRFEDGQGYALIRTSSFTTWPELVANTVRAEINQEPLAGSQVLFSPGRAQALQLPGALTDLPDSVFGRSVSADTTGEITFRNRNSLGVRYIIYGLIERGDDRLRDVSWTDEDADLGAHVQRLIEEAAAALPDPPSDESEASEAARDSVAPPEGEPDAVPDGEPSLDDPMGAIDADPAGDPSDTTTAAAPEAPLDRGDPFAEGVSGRDDPPVDDAPERPGTTPDLTRSPAAAPRVLTHDERLPWRDLRAAVARGTLDMGRGERKLVELYLQLPDGLITPRLAAFTDELRAANPTPWQYTAALMAWMQANVTYTTDLPAPSGPDANLVEEFLFEWQRGHCEYFATSLVVLLRAQGIPARIVNGFLGGDFNEVGNFYAVRQANAHSWVEVYFPDRGWMEVDPTPGGAAVFTTSSRFPQLEMFIDNLRLVWFRWVVEYDLEKQFKAARDTFDRFRGNEDGGRRASSEFNDWFRRQGWAFFRNLRALSLFGLAAVISMLLFGRRAKFRIAWSNGDWIIAAAWVSAGLAGATLLWYRGPTAASWVLGLLPPTLGTALAWYIRNALLGPRDDTARRGRGTLRVSRMQARLIRDLEKAGHPIPLSATAEEIAQSLLDLSQDAAQTLAQWAHIYQAARFGGVEPADDELRAWDKRLKEVTREVRAALRRAETK